MDLINVSRTAIYHEVDQMLTTKAEKYTEIWVVKGMNLKIIGCTRLKLPVCHFKFMNLKNYL